MKSYWTVRVIFEPRDLWIGVFWEGKSKFTAVGIHMFRVFICLIPCFPIVIAKQRHLNATDVSKEKKVSE